MKALLISILVIVSCSFAQQDVLGYKTTTWGISEDSLMTLLGNEAFKKDNVTYVNSYSGISSKVSIEKTQPWVANYLFSNKDSSLEQINIEPITASIERFNAVKNLLITKYGNPTTTSSSRAVTTIIWSFPTTTISLNMINLTRSKVCVSYKKTDKQKLNDL